MISKLQDFPSSLLATSKHYQKYRSNVDNTKTEARTPQSLNNQSPEIQNENATENDVEDEQEVKGTGNALTCKNSPIYMNSTLKGGFKAGNYTNLGRVENMNECIRLCCGNSQCNAALMLENNCFFVECKNADGCLPVKAKTTHALTALNPRVSFITSRSEEGKRFWLPKYKDIVYTCSDRNAGSNFMTMGLLTLSYIPNMPQSFSKYMRQMGNFQNHKRFESGLK